MIVSRGSDNSHKSTRMTNSNPHSAKLGFSVLDVIYCKECHQQIYDTVSEAGNHKTAQRQCYSSNKQYSIIYGMFLL